VNSGWILYDDSCGFCRRWVPYWRKTLNRRGFEIAPLQDKWVSERLQLKDTELLSDLRLLKPDDTQLIGADVYRYAMRRIWWAWPMYLLAVLPGFRSVFNWGYRTFATNRHRISASCGLQELKS
jgi:predicted DCC family thiol-disulfide oxidoreductase YuxK